MFVEIVATLYIGLLIYPVLVWLGYYSRYSHKKKRSPGNVAVIGSGIAGTAAAWSLRRSGWEVTIYETQPNIGGNAKVHKWNNPEEPTTGISMKKFLASIIRIKCIGVAHDEISQLQQIDPAL